MSRDDLLADLQGERAARPPAPPAPRPAPRLSAPTPALDVSVTPLQWSLPRVGAPSNGVGLAVHVGPVQVSLSVR